MYMYVYVYVMYAPTTHTHSHRSVPWYDAKLWQHVLREGQEGDFIWNVAAVPEDVQAAAAEALRQMEQMPA